MRVEVERKLKALEYEYGEKYIDKHEHDLSSKYRSVKLFGKCWCYTRIGMIAYHAI